MAKSMEGGMTHASEDPRWMELRNRIQKELMEEAIHPSEKRIISEMEWVATNAQKFADIWDTDRTLFERAKIDPIGVKEEIKMKLYH